MFARKGVLELSVAGVAAGVEARQVPGESARVEGAIVTGGSTCVSAGMLLGVLGAVGGGGGGGVCIGACEVSLGSETLDKLAPFRELGNSLFPSSGFITPGGRQLSGELQSSPRQPHWQVQTYGMVHGHGSQRLPVAAQASDQGSCIVVTNRHAQVRSFKATA